MKKQLTALLLAVVMIFGMLPAQPVLAAEVAYAVTGGNIYFDTATGTVTKSDTNITAAVIPDTISGVPVTSIGQNAFSYKKELVSVTLPSGLTSIGDYAFRNDESLESVTWKGQPFDPFDEKNGVQVGYLAFTDCFFLRLDFSPSYKSGMYYRNLHSDSTRRLMKGKKNYLSDVIVIAKSQLGYHEGDNYDQMDGNAFGFDDYSEYTCWWGEPGQMWCGEFVAWCIAMASVPEEVFRRKYQTTAQYTWEQTGYAGAGGSYTLKQGDVLHFDYNGGNHVCLVYGTTVNSDTVKITTLDGNHSNDVSWGSYIVDKKTGIVSNEWIGKNAKITTIYSPDVSQAAMDKLTFYKLRFDVNEGNPLEGNPEDGWFMAADEKEITYGACYGIMPLPTRDGYEFAGWYTQPQEGMEGDYKVTSYRIFKERSDQTLYARWAEYETGKEPGKEEGSGTVYNNKRNVVDNGYTWEIDVNTKTITKFPANWPGGNVPSNLDGITIEAIADSACYQNQNITTLVIPEGVTKLGASAFQSCKNLESVTIPASVREIGAQCFMYCYELEEIKFTGNIDDIRKGRYSFYRTPWFHGDYSEEFKHGPWYPKLLELQNGTDTEEDPELKDNDPLGNILKIGESQMDYHEGDTREELTGLNPKGNGEYAEPVFFSGSPDYLWFKNVPQRSYGGWCGQYCSWVLRMAGLPDVASGMLNSNAADSLKWEGLKLANKGGTHVLQAGDVLHMRIGHYCIVTNVEEKDGWVYVKTLNGNHGNAVSWDTYRLDPATGMRNKNKTKDNYDITDIYVYRPDTLSSAPKYILYFDANSGTVGINRKTVFKDAFYGLLPEPKREGYIFEGWYTEAEGGKKVTPYRKVRDSNTDVTVYAHWKADSTTVTGISMTKDNVTVKIGDTTKLTANVLPATASNKGILWRSADEKIATVNDNGVVTGVDSGEVNIIAETADGHFFGKTLVQVSDGSLRYELNDGEGYIWFNKETGIVTGVEPAKSEIHIPEKIEGVTVTEIGRNAFNGETSLTSVTIPDTVVRIGVAAFERAGLITLTIPSSVREIRGYAFSGLSNLETLTINPGATYLYSAAFYNCDKLQTVYFPNTVRYIYTRAFADCDSLKTATFQGSRNNLKNLGEDAFPEGCNLVFGTEDYSGADDYVPKSEEETSGKYEVGTRESDYKIDSNGIITFAAYNIVNAQIPETIGGITVRGFKEFSAFGTRTKLKTLSIPSTVKEIGRYSFWTCTGLETLYIPDTVETIEDYAFGVVESSKYSGSLTKVTIGKGIKKIGKYVFVRQNALEEIVIQARQSEVEIDKNAFPAGVKVTFAEECKHEKMIHHEAVEPTYEAEGSIEYWECEDCGLLFKDEAGTKEITLEDTVIEKLTLDEMTKMETVIEVAPEPKEINGVEVKLAAEVTYAKAVIWTGSKITKEQLAALSENKAVAKLSFDGLTKAIKIKNKVKPAKLFTISYGIGNQKKAGQKCIFTIKVKLNNTQVKKAKISKKDKTALNALVSELNEELAKETYEFFIASIDLSDKTVVSSVKVSAKLKSKKPQADAEGNLKALNSVTIKVKIPGIKKAKSYTYKGNKATARFTFTETDPAKKTVTVTAKEGSGFSNAREKVTVKK